MSTAKMLGRFCLFFCASLLPLLLPASAFSPGDLYLVNCGSRVFQTLDTDHRVFRGDFLRWNGLFLKDSNSAASSSLYSTAKVFSHPASYVFQTVGRGAHHLVRLHFHPFETEDFNLFEAKFHVVANGFLLFGNFSVPRNASFPVIKDFVIPAISSKVKVSFVPSGSRGLAFVNAIEVISSPKDLIRDVAQFIDVGKNERVSGLLRSGFETVHRVNVGGFKLTPFNDSLWRTWVTDDEYLVSGGSSHPFHFGGRINYRVGGASREVAPDNVYNTARVLKSLDHYVPNENITWSFDVEKGYRYMVRMHFCDIASRALHSLYFNVYINGNLAYENLDLSDITTGQLASPFYADFIVDLMSSNSLAVGVGPSNMSLPGAVGAILNGIEIWKMNNSLGSFDGDGDPYSEYRVSHLELPFALTLLIAASCFLIFAVLRRVQVYSGWTRLPVDASGAGSTK